MKILNFFPISCICLVFCYGCVNRRELKQNKITTQVLLNPVEPVVVQELEYEPIERTLFINGNIVAPYYSTVGAKIPGRLLSVLVKDGDDVKAGEVIATQETVNLQYNVNQSEANHKAAIHALRQAVLNEKENPKRSSAAVKSAEAQLKQARHQLIELKHGARKEQQRQSVEAMNAAKSNLDLAKKNLDRTQYLYNAGAVSKQQLDTETNAYQVSLSQYNQSVQNVSISKGPRPEDVIISEQSVAMAEQNLKSAIANQRLDPIYAEQVKQAKANQEAALQSLNSAKQAVADSTIRAPFNGRVFGQPAQKGTFLSAGNTIATIVGHEGIYFAASVPEVDIHKVQVSMPVQVSLMAVSNQIFPGKVVAIDNSGDTIGRLFTVRVHFEKQDPVFKNGMFATAKVNLGKINNALVIPRAAILRINDVDGVFVVEKDKAKFIPIRILLQHGTVAQIEGLKPGLQVVITGQSNLQNGTPVKVTKVMHQSGSIKGEWS